VDRRLLLIGLLVPNLLWSVVNVALRAAMSGGFSPVALAGTRWCLLAAILLPLSWAVRGRMPWPSARDRLGAFAVGFLLFGPTHALYYYALARTSTFEGTALGTTAPVWVALLAFVGLGERADARRVAGLLIGLVGAYGVSVGWQRPDF
jgi:drug/metabolite transporter (DMT)-like permease